MAIQRQLTKLRPIFEVPTIQPKIRIRVYKNKGGL